MTKQDFQTELLESFETRFGIAVITDVTDGMLNNGVRNPALKLRREGHDIAVSVGMDYLYRIFLSDHSKPYQIAGMIMDYYDRFERIFPKMRDKTDGEWTRSVYCRLVGYDANRQMLERVPHDRFLDMAVIYHFMMEEAARFHAGVILTNDHLKECATDIETLKKIARENTLHRFPPVCRPITDVLKMLSSGEETQTDIDMCEDIPVLVISNYACFYGAFSITDSSFLMDVADAAGSDLYILPSSVHECIAVPEQYAGDPGKLKNLVADVNAKEVEPQDVLTGSVYKYERAAGMLEMLNF